MVEVGVHEAKTHLSRLLERVEAGEEIVITRRGKPVAVLRTHQAPAQREFGNRAGEWSVPDDFDAPLPDGLLDAFEGSS